MQTILRGSSSEIIIDTEGPVIIIGETINPTRRKRLADTLQNDDFSYLLELAENQINDGAEVLDVNVGFPGVDDERLLPMAIAALRDKYDIPLCIDSPNPAAVEASLRTVPGKFLINSVNGEERSLNALLPVARDYGAAIIALCMDSSGITHDPEQRLIIADRIVERAVKAGIPEEDVVIDPLAMAVSADPQACLVTLDTIRLIRQKLGLNITMGASNISFGLPGREILNSSFLALAILNGLTCPIANPARIIPMARATDLILGRDDYALRFMEYCQTNGIK